MVEPHYGFTWVSGFEFRMFRGAQKARGREWAPLMYHWPQLQGKFMNVIETLYNTERTSISTGKEIDVM